jgi:hypothetical protein
MSPAPIRGRATAGRGQPIRPGDDANAGRSAAGGALMAARSRLAALTAMARGSGLIAAAVAGLWAGAVRANDSDAELAKKLSNPVASLISLPFQNNFDCCIGPERADKYTLNVQPVVPTRLTADWNLIIRTIMPLIYEGEVQPGAGDHAGLGDFTQSFFISPAKPGALIWGVGPVFLWPVGDSHLGTQKWATGPTVVALHQAGRITIGVLANQLWSYAGSSHRDRVDAAFVQPFFTYTYPNTTTISINTETSYDWTHKTWTVPINVGVSHIYKLGAQRVQLLFGGRVYAKSPDGPQTGLRLAATFLFPK